MWTYSSQPFLQVLQLALLDDQVAVVIEVLHDVVMTLLVVLEDDGLDGGIALDKDS